MIGGMNDPRSAEQAEREVEEGLTEFQLGLQRRLESSLRINTLILAGAAVISLAFAFNAMLMLENAFNVEALDHMIRNISDQTALLKQRSDQLSLQIEALALTVEDQAKRFDELTGDEGALGSVQAQAQRLAREVRQGRTVAGQAASNLAGAEGEARALAEALASERALFEEAARQGGTLQGVQLEAETLAEELRVQRSTLSASPLTELPEVASSLQRMLDEQQRALELWAQSERSLVVLQQRSEQIAEQLEKQGRGANQVSVLQGEILTAMGELSSEMQTLRAQIERERRALAQLSRLRQELAQKALPESAEPKEAGTDQGAQGAAPLPAPEVAPIQAGP